MDENVKKLIANVETALSALKAATGVNKYEDGKSVGNPIQDYDDKDVDLGGEDGSGDGKLKQFSALMKKKYNGQVEP